MTVTTMPKINTTFTKVHTQTDKLLVNEEFKIIFEYKRSLQMLS